MIAADTSTWVAFLAGDAGKDVQMLDRALQDNLVVMVPVVLTELLSDPDISPNSSRLLVDLPTAEVRRGYWQRAGLLRAKVLGRGRRARLGDALIAQCCVDQELSLITRDRDFKAFSEVAGLQLPIPL